MSLSPNSAALRFFNMSIFPHDALFVHLSAQDLVRLMRTSRRIYMLIHNVCFNITRILVPFFGTDAEVARFQRMQAETGTLISGSTALQFFNRITYPGSDLDIYAHRPKAEGPVQFLLKNGYTFLARKSQKPNALQQLPFSVAEKGPSYLGRGISDVLDFQKGDKKVQLIIGALTPMETILSFHTTCVMNIISHTSAYALYPRSTFIDNKALIIETVGAGQEAGRQKYAERGWELIHWPSVSHRSEIGVRVLRWVGDRFTWKIPISNAHLDMDMSPLTSWSIDCDGVKTKTRWSHSVAYQDREYLLADGDPYAIGDFVGNAECLQEPGAGNKLLRLVAKHRETLASHEMYF
ncbi:hypothetical protein FB45DRAFT_901016 [Roridomyces roridus]|uniref:Uncharacterized protein n=1 Tax=Roridomyces roridus TaxID=1738132 RepID=A0AAD7FT76_9AGAR|nr:hypothetical protein FB45DRAFT_901016 [Roridomyces roridus]